MDCWKHFDYLFQSQDFSKAYPAMILNEDASDPTFYEDINTKILLITNAPGVMSKNFPYRGTDSISFSLWKWRQFKNLSFSTKGKLKIAHDNLDLRTVLVASQIKKKLLSIGQLTTDNSCLVEFLSDGFVSKDQKH